MNRNANKGQRTNYKPTHKNKRPDHVKKGKYHKNNKNNEKYQSKKFTYEELLFDVQMTTAFKKGIEKLERQSHVVTKTTTNRIILHEFGRISVHEPTQTLRDDPIPNCKECTTIQLPQSTGDPITCYVNTLTKERQQRHKQRSHIPFHHTACTETITTYKFGAQSPVSLVLEILEKNITEYTTKPHYSFSIRVEAPYSIKDFQIKEDVNAFLAYIM